MAQFRDKDRAALHCNAALRARTDAIPPSTNDSNLES
jgi:hypothetical protein